MKQCSDCSHYSSDSYCNVYKIDPWDTSVLKGFVKGYEDAEDCPGFEEGNSGCFLTSALVDYLGKPDDCEELTLLRTFRDGYMRATPEGNALVKEYYEIAPRIVTAINRSENKNEYYTDIYNTVKKCVACIKTGKNKQTMDLYCDMVNKYRNLAAV